MKQLTIRSISLLLALLMVLLMIPTARAYTASGWASPEVNGMSDLGLIPDSLLKEDLTGRITRLDLCRIAVLSYEALTGQSISISKLAPFSDTADTAVAKAYAVGLAEDSDDGNFYPNALITRQDFFIFTHSFLTVLGMRVEDDGSVDLSDYPDSGKLSRDAVESTRILISLDIVQGDPQKNLLPRDYVDRQEAIATFYRVYEYITNHLEERETAIQQVIDLALEIEADDSLWYIYGGKQPSDGGFDCSGFVSYVYNTAVDTAFAPPCSAIWSDIPDSNIIPRDQLLPGDILFFWNDSKTGFQHVGLYIGDGQFVHAANSRKGIIVSGIDESYYVEHYMDAKRVIF